MILLCFFCWCYERGAIPGITLRFIKQHFPKAGQGDSTARSIFRFLRQPHWVSFRQRQAFRNGHSSPRHCASPSRQRLTCLLFASETVLFGSEKVRIVSERVLFACETVRTVRETMFFVEKKMHPFGERVRIRTESITAHFERGI